MFPGSLGGASWGGVAADPRSRLVFVNTSSEGGIGWLEPNTADATSAQTGEGRSRAAAAVPSHERGRRAAGARFGRSDTAADSVGQRAQRRRPSAWPCQKPPWGELMAVELATGEIAWRVPLGITEELPESRSGARAGSTSAGRSSRRRASCSSARATIGAFARSIRGRAPSCGSRSCRCRRTPCRSRIAATDGRQYVAIVAAGRLAIDDPGAADAESLIAYALPYAVVACKAKGRRSRIIGSGPRASCSRSCSSEAGIDSVVLERRSRDYVLGRVRAGVIEQGTVEILRRAGVAARLEREGLKHHGVEIAAGEQRYRIDFAAQGASLTVYGQTELTKDLMEARDASGAPPMFEVDDVVLEDIEGDRPRVRYLRNGARTASTATSSRAATASTASAASRFRPSVLTTHERVYPFGWLGVLADVPPVSPELIYASHERGFALCSMRSAARSRCYLQCELDIDVAEWSDERFWDELAARLPAELAAQLVRGAGDREEHRAAAQLRRGAAALRPFVPRRRRRAHRAADRREGLEPRGARRRSARGSARGPLHRA